MVRSATKIREFLRYFYAHRDGGFDLQLTYLTTHIFFLQANFAPAKERCDMVGFQFQCFSGLEDITTGTGYQVANLKLDEA